MKTQITPHGTMIEIVHNDQIYYGLLIVDFDIFKTYGNTDIEIEYLTLFDEEYNKIPYGKPIYDELSPIIENSVIYNRDDEDEMNNLIEEDEK